MTCLDPQPTRRVVNPGTGPLAFCRGCRSWRPAGQVSWARMRRNARGEVIATFAPLPHGPNQEES